VDSRFVAFHLDGRLTVPPFPLPHEPPGTVYYPAVSLHSDEDAVHARLNRKSLLDMPIFAMPPTRAGMGTYEQSFRHWWQCRVATQRRKRLCPLVSLSV